MMPEEKSDTTVSNIALSKNIFNRNANNIETTKWGISTL